MPIPILLPNGAIGLLARAAFAQFCEWSPSQRSTLRMVDAVGSMARPFLEQAPPPDDDSEILIIQVDGGGAPHIDLAELRARRQPRTARGGTKRHSRRRRRRARQRPRRAKGDKSKNAKVAFVGAIYTLHRTADGSCEGPIHKRVCATFESHAALFAWLHVEAVKRGYGQKRTLFLADGAQAIWDQQAIWFPKAEPCIDWSHIVEKLWAAGRCLHREGSAELAAWVGELVRELRRRSGADKVITALSNAYASIPKTGPGNKAKRDKLLEILEHLSKHRHRMHYSELRRDDLDIATGAVEGAVRNLVRMRLDGPGMRWSRSIRACAPPSLHPAQRSVGQLRGASCSSRTASARGYTNTNPNARRGEEGGVITQSGICTRFRPAPADALMTYHQMRQPGALEALADAAPSVAEFIAARRELDSVEKPAVDRRSQVRNLDNHLARLRRLWNTEPPGPDP